MEPAFQSHPVPQNVTNFEFHLVGDMTLKQFGYLAVGLATAYTLFIVMAEPLPYLAWPLIVISAGSGAAFAFIPIAERPLDHWLKAFIKAITKPTQLVYTSKILPKTDPLFKNRINYYLRMLQSQALLSENSALSKTSAIRARVEAAKALYNAAPITLTSQATNSSQTPAQPVAATTTGAPPQLASTTATPIVKQAVQMGPPPPPAEAKPADLKKTVELAKEAQTTQSKILEIEQQLNQIKSNAASPGADPKKYVQEFQVLLNNLQKLNENASSIAHELAVSSNTSTTPKSAATASTLPAKSIPSITLTTFPNIINGVVADANGNYVEEAIVVTHDRQGLPVRALKTNKLGQFIAATPLPNGIYTIAVEKGDLSFDVVQVELIGEISQPVLISAKKLGPAAVT